MAGLSYINAMQWSVCFILTGGSLYQTDVGVQIGDELEKDTSEEFFLKYQFLILSTCRSWVGRDVRPLVISVREREI